MGILKKILLDNFAAKKLKDFYFGNKILDVSVSDPDPKDWIHDSKITKSIDLESFSRRKICPKVKDQGRIGSCVGHSGRVVYGSADIFQKEEPSPMWIYKAGKKHDVWEGEDYSGTSIRGASKALQKEGCCFERFWPYVDTESTVAKEGARLDASYKKISSYFVIPCTDTDSIKSMLLDRPLWYAFMVHRHFFSISSDGVVDSQKYLDSPKAGGHAVALIGWKTINKKLYWEFQNSWGIFHGNLGCFFIEDVLFKKIIINSIGPYYLNIKGSYFNPDFVTPTITPTSTISKSVTPVVTPTSTATPSLSIDPTPTPSISSPFKPKSKLKLYVLIGVSILFFAGVIVLAVFKNRDYIYPEELPLDFWDKKFEREKDK